MPQVSVDAPKSKSCDTAVQFFARSQSNGCSHLILRYVGSPPFVFAGSQITKPTVCRRSPPKRKSQLPAPCVRNVLLVSMGVSAYHGCGFRNDALAVLPFASIRRDLRRRVDELEVVVNKLVSR